MAKNEKKKSGGSGKVVLFMVILGCLFPFGMPTLLVCLGFAPTVVALFTDTDKGRSSLATIAYLNLAGVLPFLIELWKKGQSMEVAVTMMSDPFTWVVMLGSAGVGQLMLFTIPPFVATMVISRQEARLRKLKQAVTELEKIWGPDVKNALSLEVVRQHKGAE